MILDFNKFIKQLNEKALNYNQLNLFDDGFSSKTIAETFINLYKSAPVVNKASKFVTVRDAYNYIDDPDTFSGDMKTRVLDSNGDSDSMVHVSTDIISDEIKELDAEGIRKILTHFSYTLNNYAAYSVFMNDADELLEPAEFSDMFDQVEYYQWNRIASDIAELIDDENMRERDELTSIFDKEIVDKMVAREIDENALDNINTDYRDELISALYSEGFDEKRINVYRSVTLPITASEIKAKTEIRGGVGIFWSHDSDATESYWAEHSEKGNFELVLHGSVNVKNVDWEETYYKSMWNLSMEKEVELTAGMTVQIVGYTLKCEDVDRTRKKLAEYYRTLDMPNEQLNNLLMSVRKRDYIKLSRPVTVKI